MEPVNDFIKFFLILLIHADVVVWSVVLDIAFLDILTRGWGLNVVSITLSDGHVVRCTLCSPEVEVPALGIFNIILVSAQVSLLVGCPVVWSKIVGVLNQAGAVKAAWRVSTPNVRHTNHRLSSSYGAGSVAAGLGRCRCLA